MERVYLLLRNNQQTGPFTIDELLQQQLQPSDMIWVEGKSAAWTYLSELELIPFMKDPGLIQNEVLKNEDEIERKAEQLRQRVLASARRAYFPMRAIEIETYASPYRLPDEELQVVDHRKERNIKRNAVFGEFLLTCIVIGLFVVGIYKGKSFLGAKDKVQNSVATQLDTGDQHTAQKNKPVTPAIIISKPDTSNQQQDSLLALQKAVQKAPVVRKRVIDSSIGSTSLNKLTLNQNEKKEDAATSSDTPVESVVNTDDLLKKELVPTVPEIKISTEPLKDEKKGFLKGLFKKKKAENSDKS